MTRFCRIQMYMWIDERLVGLTLCQSCGTLWIIPMQGKYLVGVIGLMYVQNYVVRRLDGSLDETLPLIKNLMCFIALLWPYQWLLWLPQRFNWLIRFVRRKWMNNEWGIWCPRACNPLNQWLQWKQQKLQVRKSDESFCLGWPEDIDIERDVRQLVQVKAC